MPPSTDRSTTRRARLWSGTVTGMSILAPLAELVFPRSCVGCARPGAPLCAGCAPGPPVRVLDAALGPAVPIWACGAYQDGLQAAVLGYKERGRRDLAAELGSLLAGAVAAGFDAVGRSDVAELVLVPVPSWSRVARSRGGDHVLRLARSAADRLDLAVARPLALRHRVRDSVGLGPAARARNLHAAISALPPPAPARAVLVDDIVTSGATLGEAARALAATGWTLVGAAVVAATPRRRGCGQAADRLGIR